MNNAKTIWLHFTNCENIYAERFEVGNCLHQREKVDVTNSFFDEGLFVYLYYNDEQVETLQAGWGYDRCAILIECDSSFVELVQSNPLGDDPALDEYMIPVKYFGKAKVVSYGSMGMKRN